MVNRGAAALKQANAALHVGRSRSYGGFKLSPADVMRAGAGDEQAAWTQHFERAKIEFFVAAQSTLDGAFRFGKGRRVDNDDVEFFASLRPVTQDRECVGFDPFNISRDARAIRRQISLRNFERGAGCVDAGNPAAELREMQCKSALVAADVEGAAAERELPRPPLRSGVVGVLIEKGAGLLAGVDVVVKGEAV